MTTALFNNDIHPDTFFNTDLHDICEAIPYILASFYFDVESVHLQMKEIKQDICLSVCRSGLRDLEAYSLLGGGVPNPDHLLSRSLYSVPLFSLLIFPLAMVLVPPFTPSKIHPGSLPSSAFCPYPLFSFLLPPLRPFLCCRPSTSSSVCHPSSFHCAPRNGLEFLDASTGVARDSVSSSTLEFPLWFSWCPSF